MQASRQLALVYVVVTMLAAGCAGPPAPQAGPSSGAESDGAQRPVVFKQVSAGVMGVPTTLYEKLLAPAAGSVPGVDTLEELLNAGVGHFDNLGNLRPQLAEAVPTVENGLWKVYPDGRMETTWTIRPGAQWHDGTPFTAEDLLFSAQVGQDRELPFSKDPAFDLVESVHATDARTVTIRWSKPYIQADTMFSRERALPLPKHLMQRAYSDNKAAFTELPYWSEEFVGTGPYRLREWVRGSYAVMDANDQYVLGRPKIDRVEVKFIPDANTLIANLLAGSIELTLGRSLSLDQARQVTEQWPEGRAEKALNHWLNFYPQFINPRPAVIADARFRQALLHGVDRQQLIDSLQGGLVPIADSMVNPNWPEYAEIQSAIVRYEYDPHKAAQIIEGLGFAKRSDGFFYDPAGERLVVELRTITADINQKTLLAVADYWQRLGVGVEPVVIPPQRGRDREYRATFPALEMTRPPNDLASAFSLLPSSQIPLPSNNFVGTNKSRYANAEIDLLIDKYFATIPKPERTRVVRDIVQHLTSRLIVAGLFFDAEPTLATNRLLNITAGGGGLAAQAWNAHEWDLR